MINQYTGSGSTGADVGTVTKAVQELASSLLYDHAARAVIAGLEAEASRLKMLHGPAMLGLNVAPVGLNDRAILDDNGIPTGWIR